MSNKGQPSVSPKRLACGTVRIGKNGQFWSAGYADSTNCDCYDAKATNKKSWFPIDDKKDGARVYVMQQLARVERAKTRGSKIKISNEIFDCLSKHCGKLLDHDEFRQTVRNKLEEFKTEDGFDSDHHIKAIGYGPVKTRRSIARSQGPIKVISSGGSGRKPLQTYTKSGAVKNVTHVNFKKFIKSLGAKQYVLATQRSKADILVVADGHTLSTSNTKSKYVTSKTQVMNLTDFLSQQRLMSKWTKFIQQQ